MIARSGNASRASATIASSVVTPVAAIFSASARPRAVATPTRTPVNEPGPGADRDAAKATVIDVRGFQRFLDNADQQFGVTLAYIAHDTAEFAASIGIDDAGGAEIG